MKDMRDDEIFPEDARRAPGYQLRKVQRGDDPDDWKPFDDVGAGTKETRIKDLSIQRYKNMMLTRNKK